MMHSVWEGFTSETYVLNDVFTLVSNAGKRRGDRTYVNEENVPNVSNHQYTLTPFNNAHKILSFTFKDQQERGRGDWKLNSSVLNDYTYVAMVRQTIVNVDKLNILDKQRWWDIFLTCIRFKTYLHQEQIFYREFHPGKN